eukprot:Gregarina_sp_Poly_1__2350@NODE_1629_length_3681_cov_12_076923_g1075_i0_p1_GENE_NODE_1629_length_3681_cov_12_076923_g1075_i0NODE_1629_length_3681_cov_12_076923_g1075_i0_p1_ORF_typecomplete_len882_score140_95Flavi_DEAD/PF07652_14/7_1e15OB_NTP_bind/PF07717_16/3_4e02OB_NTP_bind/PF07717_16/5_4e13DEAD/PF00270_29/9e14HA2/PF04408_23/4_5e12Helicase_C/PF00271_31/2_8e09ResIII/PF04851_15/2e08AAA_19/PF13245_6/2_7e08AAA_30/PF13604_6/1_4e05AAA_22/PF13401_6/0_00027AAA_22/PF13401_6/3_1e03AAA_22/PF13401_6/3_2e03A
MKRALDATEDSPCNSVEVFRQAKRVAVSPSSRFANLRASLPAIARVAGETSIPKKQNLSRISELPIFQHWRRIVDLVENNDVSLIVGDTGCGKTTGVPHILFKHYLKNRQARPRIVITQPRVVAATSLAKRVSEQLAKDRELLPLLGPKVNIGLGGLVGYRVRFDDHTSPETRVIFATDGLIIREFLWDVCHNSKASSELRSFQRYDYVIIDEAHERTLRIDELMGLTKVALSSRNRKFKLIVMSATLDVQTLKDFYNSADFKTGFISIPGRTFPVAINYLKAPCQDYLQAAMAALCQVMLTSESGDVLVFLPGSEDIISLCKKLRQKVAELDAFKRLTSDLERFLTVLKSHVDIESRSTLLTCESPEELQTHLRKMFGIEYLSSEELASFFRCVNRANMGSFMDIIVQYKAGDFTSLPCKKADTTWLQTEWIILPLYSQLSYEEQQRVFLPPKNARQRKIIVSTNIAETSITLPNITYVIDSGKVKLKFQSSLKMVDVSSAMSKQRSGRAGRVQEGTAYRLFTEDHFWQLEEQAVPEIARCDIADLLLDLKTVDGENRQLSKFLGADTRNVLQLNDFPLPTYPSKTAVEDAELLLYRVGAFKGAMRTISERGMKLAALPLPVLWGNLILEGIERKCLAEMLTIVAMLSLDIDWFPQVDDNPRDIITKRRRILHPDSDHIGLLNLFTYWQRASDRRHFCRLLQIEERNLQKALQTRDQLKKLLTSSEIFQLKEISSALAYVEEKDKISAAHKVIRECLAFGLFSNIATRRDDMRDSTDGAAVYVSILDKEKITIHPSSTFYLFQHQRPESIVYSSIIETQQRFAKDVSAIDSECALQIQAVASLHSQSVLVDAAFSKTNFLQLECKADGQANKCKRMPLSS